jgi:ABC-type multidrug transport system ATPase subunit
MSIITSIHQPNNDLFMMFNNIYVLAKGGICVYSDLPQDLKTHLSECDIICNEFQVPIEVLLKVSSEGINDKNVKKIVQ